MIGPVSGSRSRYLEVVPPRKPQTVGRLCWDKSAVILPDATDERAARVMAAVAQPIAFYDP